MDAPRYTLNDGYPTITGFKAGAVYTYRNERDGFVTIRYLEGRYIIAGNRDGKPFTHTRADYQLAKAEFLRSKRIVAAYGIKHPQVERRTNNLNVLHVRAYDYSGLHLVRSKVRFMPIRKQWKVEKVHPTSVAHAGWRRIPKTTDIRCETLFDAMCVALGGRIE